VESRLSQDRDFLPRDPGIVSIDEHGSRLCQSGALGTSGDPGTCGPRRCAFPAELPRPAPSPSQPFESIEPLPDADRVKKRRSSRLKCVSVWPRVFVWRNGPTKSSESSVKSPSAHVRVHTFGNSSALH
jgi:hypothetical protein